MKIAQAITILLIVLAGLSTSILVGCGNTDQKYDEYMEERKAELEEETSKSEPFLSDVAIDLILLLFNLVILIWIVFFDGAEWLEGSVFSSVFLFFWAPRWTASGIRLYSSFLLASTALYLIVQLVKSLIE